MTNYGEIKAVGTRVILVKKPRKVRSDIIGMHGEVVELGKKGWCTVRLDNGRFLHARFDHLKTIVG